VAAAAIIKPWATAHGFVLRPRRKGEGTMMFPLGSFVRGDDPADVIEPQFDKHGRPLMRLNVGREAAIWTAHGRDAFFLEGYFHLPRSPGFAMGPGFWRRLLNGRALSVEPYVAALPRLLDEALRWFETGEVGPDMWPIPPHQPISEACLRLAAYREDPRAEVLRVLTAAIRLESGFAGPIAPDASPFGTGILAPDNVPRLAGRLKFRLGIEVSDLAGTGTLEDLTQAALAQLRLAGIEDAARGENP
jgi:hypothetical protein